ncbi:hypothetical protein [Rivibacter subsaxonicus]|uniref:hypothetical protein n=1 Tax=Rivibacter subsaxonicus TaxID=457575 RepID=UPI00102CFF2D|nr:hypothetical protein [Rivibacter subsaxonicus]
MGAQESAGEPAAAGANDPLPYFLRVSQGFAHDDNLFRVPDEFVKTSDWVSSTALIGGFDQPFGRQRGYGNVTLRGNAYKDQSQLNNFSYDLRTGLDWSTVERLSGNVDLKLAQSLARFSDYGSTARERSGKNQELSQYIGTRVQYGITAAIALEALVNYQNIDYTAEAFDDRARRALTYGGGVKFAPRGVWTLGLGARHTDGTYPRSVVVNGQFAPDDYTRDSIDLTARLNATGLSTFSGRLSYTREEHELDTTRDFKGWTGQIGWNYQATGKLNFGLSYLRDTGTNTSTTGASGVETFLTDARLTDRFGIDGTWDATGKIQVKAGVEYWRNTFDDQFTQIDIGGQVISASGQTADNYLYTLLARYQATRSFGLECGARYEDRDTSITTARTIVGFKATMAYCNATLSLRG